MKEGPAYHAASAGEQTVENSSGGAEVRHADTLTEKDKPRGKASPNYGFAKAWAELKAGLNRE